MAHDNLDASTRMLADIKSLRTTAAELLALLDDDDHAVKFVYKKCRGLLALRERAGAGALAAAGGPGGGGGGTVAVTSSLTASLDATFFVVYEVVAELENRLWENLRDGPMLADSEPAVLVRTAEVIEMDDRSATPLFMPGTDRRLSLHIRASYFNAFELKFCENCV